jgi:hypothetical protein
LVFALAVQAGSAHAASWLDTARYEDLNGSDPATLQFVLGVMYEVVFYAQGSVGKPVICATPVPIEGARLIGLVDREIVNPNNSMHPEYQDTDYVAFALMNALKTERVQGPL